MYGDGTSPANQYGSQAGEAWAAGHTGSKTIYVGVIDEGIQVTHPDLDANWGGFSQALKDAIDRAGAANILFIAAAGNSAVNIDASPSYPASYTSANVLSVASITNTGALSSFSNYGATHVDIGAPGSTINSTLPFNTYGACSGTSMATPHVTGGAALRAAHSTSRGAALKADILNAAVPTASLAGKCVTGGRLNVSGF